MCECVREWVTIVVPVSTKSTIPSASPRPHDASTEPDITCVRAWVCVGGWMSCDNVWVWVCVCARALVGVNLICGGSAYSHAINYFTHTRAHRPTHHDLWGSTYSHAIKVLARHVGE